MQRRKISFEDRVTTRIYNPTDPVEITTISKKKEESMEEKSKDQIISDKYRKICEAQGINEKYIESIVRVMTSTFHDTPSSRLYILETILRVADFPYFSSKSSVDIRHAFDLKKKNKKTK